MGEVRVEVELVNYGQQYMADQGLLDREKVTRVTVTGIVDTGATTSVLPRDIADRLVRRLTTPDLVEHMDLAPDIAVIEMVAPTEFVGKSLADLGIRARHEIHVIGVVRPGVGDEVKRVVVAPPADLVFREGEVLLLLGKIENLNRFTDLYPRG